MPENTEQMRAWMGAFGREYTDRNTLAMDEMEALYKRNYGVTRTELNQRFLERIPLSAHILEVGSNIGNQLLCLQNIGFLNLCGIEAQGYAVEISSSRTRHMTLIQGSAFNIPFRDNCFDLVFTSGLLIHINPYGLHKAMEEIHRCTKEYIWGFECYADRLTNVMYRGHDNLMWKTDYVRLYLDLFSDLELIKEERLNYLDNGNIDSMFLLRKEELAV